MNLEIGFAIVIVYVNDLNLVETREEIMKTTKYLKNEFEIEDLRKQKKKSDLYVDEAFFNWIFGSPISIC